MNGYSEEIVLEGHIIDSWILPKVFDTVMDLGGEFDLQEIRVGRRKDETSFARLKISADDDERLHRILAALQDYGADIVSGGNMLPASVKVVAVDINPAVVTELADSGTFQALGLVTDAELFMRELAEALGVAEA